MAHHFIDKFGYRRQRANPISRVGVFPYTGEQIDQPKKDANGKPIFKRDDLGRIMFKRNSKTGRIETDDDGDPIPEYEMQFGLEPKRLYPVLRGPDALFAPDAIESFNGLPIRVGHLMIGDESKNNKDEKDKKLNSADKNPNDGCIYNVRPSLDEPGYLIADFCIYTDRMKDILKEGKVKELSLGYTCIYEEEDGEYEGVPYMFKQTNLRGNHLALVKHGRCGSTVCVYDQAVVTFDSLPEGIPPMEDNKEKEIPKLERAKALASAIKGGDEQLAQDCLDFADFPPEVRKEALERCKAGKCEKKDGEKDVSDKAPKSKAAKDSDDVPVPPELPKGDDATAEKPAESNAPASSAASAPAPAATPEPNSSPAPQDVPSPKDGENPVSDKGCKDKAAKDCGQGVTQPSIPTPVSAIQAPEGDDGKEAKDKAPAEAHVCDKCGCDPCKCGKEGEDKECKDKAPAIQAVQVEGEKKVENTPDGEEVKETVTAKGTADKDDTGRIKADVVAEHDNKAPGESKVAQDEYAAFIAEYTAAQALANKLRPYIKETFDSAPMRVIDVARFAAKHIETLAFVQDEADDATVLNAVRGYAAAVAMDSAKKQDVFVDKVQSADVLVQDEAPAMTPKATPKDLREFLNT